METITMRQHGIEYRMDIKDIKKWRELYHNLVISVLKKVKEYYECFFTNEETFNGEKSKMIFNSLIGCQYPQIIEHLEEMKAIKKVGDTWVIVWDGITVNNYYLYWRRMENASNTLKFYEEQIEKNKIKELDKYNTSVILQKSNEINIETMF